MSGILEKEIAVGRILRCPLKILDPWCTRTFSQLFTQTVISVLLWWDFADAVKVSNHLTLRLSKWTWPNHMHPLEAESFLPMITEKNVRETHIGWPGRKQTSRWTAYGGHMVRNFGQLLGAQSGPQLTTGGKRGPWPDNHKEMNSANF